MTIAPGVGGSVNWQSMIHWGATGFVQHCKPVNSFEQVTRVVQVNRSRSGGGGGAGIVCDSGELSKFGSGPTTAARQPQPINNGNNEATFKVEFSGTKQSRV